MHRHSFRINIARCFSLEEIENSLLGIPITVLNNQKLFLKIIHSFDFRNRFIMVDLEPILRTGSVR